MVLGFTPRHQLIEQLAQGEVKLDLILIDDGVHLLDGPGKPPA